MSGLLVIRCRNMFIRLTVNLSLRQKLGLNEEEKIITVTLICIQDFMQLVQNFTLIKIFVSLPSCLSRTQAASLLQTTNVI